MSTPLPVPSKAAIRALRGLALGTSCALGLIVEDRRRRISTLRTAVHNMKKIKSARQYHGAAETTAQTVDDAVILSGTELHWHCRQDPPRTAQVQPLVQAPPSSNTSRKRRLRESLDEADTLAIPGSVAQPSHELPSPSEPVERSTDSLGKSNPQIPGLRPPSQLPGNRDSGGWVRSPTILSRPRLAKKITEILSLPVSDISELLDRDGTALVAYTDSFLAECQVKAAFNKLDSGWHNVSAALCKHCLLKGRSDDAQKILAAVVRAGPLDEEVFYAHDPISVIESILPAPDTDRRDLVSASLQLATRLFLAKFNEKPGTHSEEILELGKTLISRLLHFNHPQFVHQVYWRVLGQLEQPELFTAWFIKALFDYRDCKSVIKYFKLNFSKMSPNLTCFNGVMHLVVESVEEMRGAQVDQVLRALVRLCDATGLRPMFTWINRLLQAHWDRYKDLSKSKELFGETLSIGLLDRVNQPEQVYQIMVKLSVLAGDYSTARHFYQETMMLAPHMSVDIWLNGYMALAKAKTGDWAGVMSDFKSMKPHRMAQDKAYAQTFVAVLKVFVEGHPVSDVEDFIKLYTQEMDVRMHRYIVTLVANKYGELRDPESFINWLRYCSSEGFALDPAFSNAILRNCRLKWKFPFQQLRLLFSAMRRLEPKCVDTVTERMMHNAALEDGNYSGANTRQRIGLLKVALSKLPYHSRSANERDVLHAMTEELVHGHAAKAVSIYKRAVRFGMPWCPRCFRVAVQASLQQKGDNYNKAIKLIGDTHQHGHDVSAAVAVYIKAQLKEFRGPFEEVMLHLRNLITSFESLGMLIDTSILTHTAIIAAQFGQFEHAISLCRLAMEKSGTQNPCFSGQSLRALLMVYWQQLDIQGLKWVVESLPSSRLAADRKAFQLLLSTKNHMKKWKQSARVATATEILQHGIDEMKQRRAAQIAAGSMIYNETLRIMGDAAADLERDGHEEGDVKRHESPTEEHSRRVLLPDLGRRVSAQACA
ncbi:hypothetical protein BJ170DRAFT_612145 [Xylariales sp. AK1849]|nr:hypothetical protein BJ170DRAFT_612145 [Xylariales sp. AK1849]